MTLFHFFFFCVGLVVQCSADHYSLHDRIVESSYGKRYFVNKAEWFFFDDAQAKCASVGGALPTAKTQQEVDFIRTLIDYSSFLCFLGARGTVIDGKCVYRWISDGSLVTNAKWHETPRTDDYCYGATLDRYYGRWFSYPINFMNTNVICELKPEVFTAPNGREYVVFENTTNFEGAQAKCAEINASLPTVKTEQQLFFVTSLVENRQILIGAMGSRVEKKCVYNWLSDGSEVTNAEWFSGYKPNSDRCSVAVVVKLSDSKPRWLAGTADFIVQNIVCELKESSQESFRRTMTGRLDRMNDALQLAGRTLNEFKTTMQEKFSNLESSLNGMRDLMQQMVNKQKDNEKKIEYLYG